MKASSLATSMVTRLKQPSRRLVILLVVIVWANAMNVFLFHHRQKTYEYLTNKFNQINPLNNYDGHAIPKKLVDSLTVKYWLNEEKIVSDPRRIERHASNYDSLFSKHPLEEVLQLGYQDRCDAFFKNLYVTSDSKWALDAPDRFKIDMEYEMPWEDYKRKYEKEVRERIAKSQNKEPDKVSGDDIHKAIAKVYDGLKDKAKKNEQEMREQLAYGRIFNKCFVTRDEPEKKSSSDTFASSQARSVGRFSEGRFVANEDERKLSPDIFPDCADLETRMYPWLSFQSPVYERYSGQVSKTPPNMESYINIAEQPAKQSSREPIRSKLTGNRPCWLSTYKNSLNGRGIVIPYDGKSMDNAVALIRLLRALNNKLPIQVVSYGKLDEQQKQTFSDVARAPIHELPESYKKIKDAENFVNQDDGLPPQELWFVDASAALVHETTERWDDFPLSILAAFVTSFQEMLLLDPSAVPLKNPEYFFNLDGYKQHGAYFYRAKPWSKIKEKNIDFFNIMAPSIIDKVVFDIPILTQQTLDLPFWHGLKEMQDSGVVVINKHRHFATLVTLMQAGAYWPVSYRGNIQQELWLSFALAGDEDFTFNKHCPAALGDTFPDEEKSPQLCSVHAGHFDPDTSNSLAWMTNGFPNCPIQNPDVSDDFGSAFSWHTFETPENMVDFYKSKFQPKAAIIPPYVNTDSLDLKNDDNNPKSPWEAGKGCENKVFCANGEIGGSGNHGSNLQKGQFLELDSKERDFIAFYGDIWIE
ncbi:hypothetical protein FDK38_003691 [Candidozyma auris]|nr:hypothetical protein FDK38_003691 [[Candida] auris]